MNVGTELAGDMLINRYVNKDARARVTVQALVNAGVVTAISDDDTEARSLYVFDSARKTGQEAGVPARVLQRRAVRLHARGDAQQRPEAVLGQAARRRRLPQGRRRDRRRRPRPLAQVSSLSPPSGWS